MADSWVSFLADYRDSIEQALRFVLVFVVAGLFTRGLLRRVVYAANPAAIARRTKRPVERGTRVWLAVVDLVAWSFAFVVAAQGLDLSAVPRLFIGFVGSAVVAAAVLVAAGLVVYSFSTQGRELILSVLGGWYLRRRMKGEARDLARDLGEGMQGKVASINLLHTEIDLVGGGKTSVPNAFLMRRLFGFGKENPGQGSKTETA